MGAFVLPNDVIPDETPLTTFVVPVEAVESSAGLTLLPEQLKQIARPLCQVSYWICSGRSPRLTSCRFLFFFGRAFHLSLLLASPLRPQNALSLCAGSMTPISELRVARRVAGAGVGVVRRCDIIAPNPVNAREKKRERERERDRTK